MFDDVNIDIKYVQILHVEAPITSSAHNFATPPHNIRSVNEHCTVLTFRLAKKRFLMKNTPLTKWLYGTTFIKSGLSTTSKIKYIIPTYYAIRY